MKVVPLKVTVDPRRKKLLSDFLVLLAHFNCSFAHPMASLGCDSGSSPITGESANVSTEITHVCRKMMSAKRRAWLENG